MKIFYFKYNLIKIIMFGLIINIVTKNNILEKTFNVNSLEESKIELINFLATEFNKLNIDFPISLDDFEYIWCDYQSMDMRNNIFNYNIFDSFNNKWIKTWVIY
jgi:hypothetical protein